MMRLVQNVHQISHLHNITAATAPISEGVDLRALVRERSTSAHEEDGIAGDVVADAVADQAAERCACSDNASDTDADFGGEEHYYFCHPDWNDVAWRNHEGMIDPVAVYPYAYACNRAEVIIAVGDDHADTLELVGPDWAFLATKKLPSFRFRTGKGFDPQPESRVYQDG